MRTRPACAVLAMIAGAACTDAGGGAGLHPEGPPMILQVLLDEKYGDGAVERPPRRVFAFGAHALAAPEEVHPVEAAVAVGNELRIVVDELLVGNNLEELACRGPVDDDPGESARFGRVPSGAEPDDVARCAVADDALASSCPGTDRRSVCICRRAAGCLRGGVLVPEGAPVGVRDDDLDGAADAARMVPGAVGIQCGSATGSITVPANLAISYWYPSGSQQPPPLTGLDGLGPAIVLAPGAALPTGLRCGLAFAPDVVDKQGEPVCAPLDGELAAGCAPGDVSAFAFRVEPLAIRPASFTDGATGVSRSNTTAFSATAPIDAATLGGIQIAPAPPAPPSIGTQLLAITLAWATPLAPLTEYTVTFPATIRDTYGQPLPAARSYRFTTGN